MAVEAVAEAVVVGLAVLVHHLLEVLHHGVVHPRVTLHAPGVHQVQVHQAHATVKAQVVRPAPAPAEVQRKYILLIDFVECLALTMS